MEVEHGISIKKVEVNEDTNAATNTTYNEATTSAAGLMTAADKTKLNGVETGANKVTVSVDTSTNSLLITL